MSTSDSIAEFFGPVSESKSRATVHHLATHKAGLVPRGYSLSYGTDRSAFVDSVIAAPQESTPGSEYRYTNAGYSLLAAILEVATEESWVDYVRDQILSEPGHGIRFYSERAEIEPLLAHGYAIRQGQASFSSGEKSLDWGTIGAAGIYARARDLVWIVNSLIRENPFQGGQRDKMLDFEEEEAYGWHVDLDERGRNRIHKGGDSIEYTSQIIYYPDIDVTITWMVNNNRTRWRTILRDGLVAWVHGEEIPSF